MSVSAYNQSVALSVDNASPADPKSSAGRSGATVSTQVTVGVNFAAQQSYHGPVFGGPPPRPLPIGLRPNPGPPPRPSPSLPYFRQDNDQLAGALFNKYDALEKRLYSSGGVTASNIENMAKGFPFRDDVRLAKEIVKRPGLLDALRRNAGTGDLDNRISKDDLVNFMQSKNPLKISSDRSLIQEMVREFPKLTGSDPNSISFWELRSRSNQPLTGISSTDRLIQLSQEVMARSSLKSSMDSIVRNEKISLWELKSLLS
ncbi:hypothetical protein [Pseudomonas sp. DWP1b1]|uniref:hypothetical protein n=1 Tax=unclassified Pseudomonas TaxID=196821 RepID=UPI003CF8BC11